MNYVEIGKEIIKKVKQTFKESPCKNDISAWKIYIYIMSDSGMILYDDKPIPAETLYFLFKHGYIRCEGIFFHQATKALRYRFNGYSYPDKYYRKISNELRRIIMEKDNGSCVECGSYDNLQIDHIFPWSKGGLTEVSNLQLLCKNCNYQKAAKL